jgi:LacI family transcriptional regulator
MAEATIRDVARRADVSVASVSRALNGLNNVGPETRARVIAAATELGYVPHAGARSLSLARAHAIGVVLPDFHGEFFSEIVRGMDREASRRGYLLLLSNIHAEGDQARSGLRAMHGRVDGLLVMAPHIDPSILSQSLPSTLPALLLNQPGESISRPSLRLDNVAGADAVVRHLVDNGYRRIVHIAGPKGNLDAQERADAYFNAMRRYAPDVKPTVLKGDFSEGAGEAAARLVLNDPGRFNGIFAANDMMAIGCLQSLRSAGVAVPGDFAVAGFDDVPLARYLALTTVRVSIAELGERAVRRLVDMLEKKEVEQANELHVPELVARATTARPSSAQAKASNDLAHD